MTEGMPVNAESIASDRHELRCARLTTHTMCSGSRISAQQVKRWSCVKQKVDAGKVHVMNMHQNQKLPPDIR
ncbi:MAG: hypothetical protein ACUVTD_05790 [Nitrososphaerales archaeon]